MTTELTTKESIRLGQAMNIVGNKFAKMEANMIMSHVQLDLKEQTLALYKLLGEIEAEVLAKKNEKKTMEFPK